jgi:hypothetical protein
MTPANPCKFRRPISGFKPHGWGRKGIFQVRLFTSTSQFELSVVYGLDLITFKQAEDVNEFAENIARKNIVKDAAALAIVKSKFDRMAMSRPSVFRVTDAPDF